MAYYALKKDVFDINKITVVGNPTISDDGVANLTTGTALYADVSIANGANTVIEFDYVYKKNTSAVQLLWIAYPSQDDHTEIYWTYISTDGKVVSTNSFSTNTLTENVKYHFTIKTDFATYNEAYVDGVLWCRNTHTRTQNVGQIYIANRYDKLRPVASPFDLKTFKITVANQLVFQPVKPIYLLERRKEGYDPSKFTIVGSPTITNDGVASRFSSLNYLDILGSVKSLNKPYLIRCDFVYRHSSANQNLFGFMQNSYQDMVRVVIRNNGILSFEIFLNGVENSVKTTRALTSGKKYTLECGQKENDTMFIKLKKYGSTNWTEKHNANKDLVDFTQLTVARIGNSVHTTLEPFVGSINLPSISITVDGKEVFTGSKYVYYALRR